MTVLRKFFGVKETDNNEGGLLRSNEGRERKLIKMDKENLELSMEIFEKLEKFLKIYRKKRAAGRPIPRDFDETLRHLEEHLGLTQLKISKEMEAVIKEEAVALNLLNRVEEAVERM